MSRRLWPAVVALVVGLLFLGASGLWGLWEPWETEYARMGRALTVSEDTPWEYVNAAGEEVVADSLLPAGVPDSWLRPANHHGDSVNKSWLSSLLYEWGYSMSRPDAHLARVPIYLLIMALLIMVPLPISRRWQIHAGISTALAGGVGALFATEQFTAEFMVRAPSAALGVLTALVVYFSVRAIFSPARAAITALILATSPFFFFSAVNLAGAMPLTATVTMALCAWSVALLKRRFGWALVGGLFSGLSLWAGGVVGPLLILGALGLYGVWPLTRRRPWALVILAGLATAAVMGRPYVAEFFGFEPGAEPEVFAQVWLPSVVVVLLVIGGILGGAYARAHRTGSLLGLGVFAVVAALPIIVTWQPVFGGELEGLLRFLTHNDFINSRGLADNPSFDLFIRQLGFAGFPYTILLPLGLAYLGQTIGPEAGDGAASQSDDYGDEARAAFKVILLCWLGLSFLLVGLGARLSNQFLFGGIFPLSAAVGLLVSDTGYWRGFRRNKTALYLTGVGCLVVLLVLTKDLRTVANTDLGQLGPEVLFEFLLFDGREAFPKNYGLDGVVEMSIVWAASLAIYFWLVFSWLERLPQSLRRRVDGLRAGMEEKNGAARWAGYVMLYLSIGTLWRLLDFVFSKLQPAVRLVRRVVEKPMHYAIFVVVSGVGFAAIAAAMYLPRLADHLSTRALIDRYIEYAEPGETIYRVGSSRASNDYYLSEETITVRGGSENAIEPLRSVDRLRPFFCDNTQRVWALIDRDALSTAYNRVRREGDELECDPERDLWVLYGRSSRFALVSNQLRDPEEDESPLRQYVVAEVPVNVTRPEAGVTDYIFGDRDDEDEYFQLVGYQVLTEDGDPLESASSGDVIYIETYWEVLATPSSTWKMFVHVDYAGSRINGDHDVMNGEFPMNAWVPGEIVLDRHALEVERGSKAGMYTIHMGFFRGDPRLDVMPPLSGDQVSLTQIHITGGL